MPEIHETRQLLGAVKRIYPVVTFLRNRYFETTARDIFSSKKVLMEFKKGGRKLAPFVFTRTGGVNVGRSGYYAEEYEPAYIAPKTTLTLDDLEDKGFGHTIYEEHSPQEREAILLGEDLRELSDSIDRRIEWMCGQLLCHGEVIMKHYSGEYGNSPYQTKRIAFYEDSFENEYAPLESWKDLEHDIYLDFENIVAWMEQRGQRVADIVMGAEASSYLIRNEKIQKLLENRRIHLGTIEPERMPDGAALLGTINVRGYMLNLISYSETFEDEDGSVGSFVDTDRIVAAVPKLGKILYGAITQIEKSDGKFHTYKGQKVPKYYSDSDNETRAVRLASAPVTVPKDTDMWMTSKVIFD